MAEVENTKPVCGGGEEQGEYDLPLHVAALCKSTSMASAHPLDES